MAFKKPLGIRHRFLYLDKNREWQPVRQEDYLEIRTINNPCQYSQWSETFKGKQYKGKYVILAAPVDKRAFCRYINFDSQKLGDLIGYDNSWICRQKNYTDLTYTYTYTDNVLFNFTNGTNLSTSNAWMLNDLNWNCYFGMAVVQAESDDIFKENITSLEIENQTYCIDETKATVLFRSPRFLKNTDEALVVYHFNKPYFNPEMDYFQTFDKATYKLTERPLNTIAEEMENDPQTQPVPFNSNPIKFDPTKKIFICLCCNLDTSGISGKINVGFKKLALNGAWTIGIKNYLKPVSLDPNVPQPNRNEVCNVNHQYNAFHTPVSIVDRFIVYFRIEWVSVTINVPPNQTVTATIRFINDNKFQGSVTNPAPSYQYLTFRLNRVSQDTPLKNMSTPRNYVFMGNVTTNLSGGVLTSIQIGITWQE